MCAVHLRLTGKPAVDFLLVITKLLSLGVMVEALQAFLEGGQFGPKFQVEGNLPHQPFFLCIDLSYSIRMWAEVSFILSQSRVWQMDRRTSCLLEHRGGITAVQYKLLSANIEPSRPDNTKVNKIQLKIRTTYVKRIAYQSKTDHHGQDKQTHFFAPVTLTTTRWSWHMNLT